MHIVNKYFVLTITSFVICLSLTTQPLLAGKYAKNGLDQEKSGLARHPLSVVHKPIKKSRNASLSHLIETTHHHSAMVLPKENQSHKIKHKTQIPPTVNVNIAQEFYNLGWSYANQGNVNKALETWNKTLTFNGCTRKTRADTLLSLGRTWSKLKKSREAILYWNKALEVKNKHGNFIYEGNQRIQILADITKLYVHQGDMVEAIGTWGEAAKICAINGYATVDKALFNQMEQIIREGKKKILVGF